MSNNVACRTCPLFTINEIESEENIIDFMNRLKKKYNYLYSKKMDYYGQKVVLNNSINIYGEKEGLDHIMTKRNHYNIYEPCQERIERAHWVELMFQLPCSNCQNFKKHIDKTHKISDKNNKRYNLCCSRNLYMITVEYIYKRNELLIISAYKIKKNKYLQLFGSNNGKGTPNGCP